MAGLEQRTPEQLAEREARYFEDLMWHVGTFAIINAFLWFLDLWVGQDGAQWAYWVTVAWGIGLAFHVLAYLIDGRSISHRRVDRLLHGGRHHHRMT
ncbi:2TM domain-containing protein [Ilumatobacter sp.]|uniref:2TM domain-containing protein n=1 Tax=Ilumatobacter sp. TaxID=1967498 RepID=UPI0026256476|nr:2TM domain-containing protein [Ilumatobacter sp.]